MRVAVIDYGMGNLGSVTRAFRELGATAYIAERPALLEMASCIVLPGVGSFADGMTRLIDGGWVDEIRNQVSERAKPLLGICLGMQLLATEGSEGGHTKGLDLVPGHVERLDALGCTLRIPHVGWNSINVVDDRHGALSGIPSGTDFYFVHSYAYVPADERHVLAQVEYDVPVAAAIGCGLILGTQFHPEKSSRAGFRVLGNFLRLAS
jgi:glutamine amidotransferase